MPFPAVDEPRPDVRKPTYAKGQWFGAVPRTRIFLQVSTASSPLDFLADGCVVQSIQFPTDPQPPGQALWVGTVSLPEGTCRVEYQSAVLPSSNGVGFCQIAVSWPLPDPGVALYRDSGFDWRPGSHHTLDILTNQTGVSLGPTALAIWVPEWATPSERWPAATISEPVP